MKTQEENQAEKLQQLFQEVSNQPVEVNERERDTDADYIEIDVLNLPPRSEVHKKSTFRYSFSFRSPVARLLIVLFIVLCAVGLIYYIAGDQILQFL